jgi:hypothetical protein
VAAQSEVKALTAWTLRSWVRTPRKAWMFVLVCVALSSSFCVVLSYVGRGLCDGLITVQAIPTDCLNILRSLPCEVGKVLARTVEPLVNEGMKSYYICGALDTHYKVILILRVSDEYWFCSFQVAETFCMWLLL